MTLLINDFIIYNWDGSINKKQIYEYEKSPVSILVNDIMTKEYNKNKIGFNVEYLSVKDIQDVVFDMGIKMASKISSNNLVDEIINSISNQNPVIVCVDCYYESIRTDSYLKSHWPHNLLVYGYDRQNRTFDIIEHKHRENLTYKQCKISYSDMINSYDSYQVYFQQQLGMELPSYFEFCINQDGLSNVYSMQCVAPECTMLYARNLHKHKELIYQNLEELSKFFNMLKQEAFNENYLMDKVEDLIGVFNNIINAKKAEGYKLLRLFEENHINSKITEILYNWAIIRATLAKYMYSLKYEQDAHVVLINSIERITQLEYQSYDIQFELISKYL